MNIQQQLEKRGISFFDYKKNLNLSYIFATCAENCYMLADDLLKKGSQYRLTEKQLFTILKRTTKKLLFKAENLKNDEMDEAFYSAVDFIQNLAYILAEKELSEEDEIKIISYIKNNF